MKCTLHFPLAALLASCVVACGNGDTDADADGDIDADGDGDGDVDDGSDGDAESCQDYCPAVDDMRCNGDIVETCAEDADGCLKWEETEDCSAMGMSCRYQVASPACMVCDRGAWDGDHEITDEDSLRALSGHTSVSGDIDIVGTDLMTVEGLECLEEVGGVLA